MTKRQYLPTTRRAVLGGIGAAGITGVIGTAAANPGRGNGFPPQGLTVYSDPEPLGNGEVTAFYTEHPPASGSRSASN